MRHWKIMGAILSLLAEAVLQLSGYQNIGLAIVLALLMVGLLLWSAWPMIKRIRFQKPLKLTGGKSEVSPKLQLPATPSWLEQILEDDRLHLDKRIYARDYIWSFSGLKNIDSFLEVTITLINAAVFSVLIEGIKGSLSINEQECAQGAEMKLTRILHGESGNIRIKQHLSQEMVNLIILHCQEPLKISLKSCQLIILPEIIGKDTKLSDIGIFIEQNVSIPQSDWRRG